jgi:hypothetical protein
VREYKCHEIVSALLGCWPEPILVVARRVGVTKPELDAYLAGQSGVSEAIISRLMQELGLRYDRETLLADGSYRVASINYYVLIAGNAMQRVLDAYDFLMDRGDQPRSVELVPSDQSPGHRWRYLLITHQSEMPSLICFARIGRAASLLERGQLTAFQGRFNVDPALYAAVASLRKEVEQQPSRAMCAMRGFYDRWKTDVSQIHGNLASAAGER